MPQTTWWHYSMLGTDIQFSKEISRSVLHPQMPNSVPANCRVLAKGGEAWQAFVSFSRGQMCLLVITFHVLSLILRGTHINNTYAFPVPEITGRGGGSMLAKQCALQKKNGSVRREHMQGSYRTQKDQGLRGGYATICYILPDLFWAWWPPPPSPPMPFRPEPGTCSDYIIRNSQLWLWL